MHFLKNEIYVTTAPVVKVDNFILLWELGFIILSESNVSSSILWSVVVCKLIARYQISNAQIHYWVGVCVIVVSLVDGLEYITLLCIDVEMEYNVDRS